MLTNCTTNQVKKSRIWATIFLVENVEQFDPTSRGPQGHLPQLFTIFPTYFPHCPSLLKHAVLTCLCRSLWAPSPFPPKHQYPLLYLQCLQLDFPPLEGLTLACDMLGLQFTKAQMKLLMMHKKQDNETKWPIIFPMDE